MNQIQPVTLKPPSRHFWSMAKLTKIQLNQITIAVTMILGIFYQVTQIKVVRDQIQLNQSETCNWIKPRSVNSSKEMNLFIECTNHLKHFLLFENYIFLLKKPYFYAWSLSRIFQGPVYVVTN